MISEAIQPQLLPDASDLAQLEKGLHRLFEIEDKRIVFWHDADQQFVESVNHLSLPDVAVLRLDEEASLALKIRLECTDPQGRYLLYAPFEVPSPEEDWLLDIRLYSGKFEADRASILLQEIGLGESQFLRTLINTHLKFFNKGDRKQRLTKLVSPTDDEHDVRRKMLAVLVRAEHPEPFQIFVTLFHDLAGAGGVEAQPASWDDIEKFGLMPAFWRLAERTFGYSEENPNLRNLLLRLLVSDFAHSCHAPLPSALAHLTLPKEFWPDAAVCLNQWRDSTTRSSSYDSLSGEVGAALNVRELLHSLTPEALLDVMTFLEVEQHIIAELRDRLIENTIPSQNDNLQAIGARRQSGHWAAPIGVSGSVARRALHAAYNALAAASRILSLVPESAAVLLPDALAAYRAYEESLYLVDQNYRHFCENSAIARQEGWDVLKLLCEKIEAVYGNGYLTPLGIKWSELVERDLLGTWQIEGVPNQYRFYETQIKQVLDDGEVQHIVVIISDAFRYEAAQELTAELNGKYRMAATLSTQLGVLPSYTALGMASLLPHQSLSYNAKGDVLADERSTVGTENLRKILEKVQGQVIGAEEFMKMTRDVGRALLRDNDVLYIYHDTIDSIGDKSATEDNTFRAVRTAIDELGQLVSRIVNTLNGSYVLVTADHGFLYQETSPDKTQKSSLDDKPKGTIIAKKRYLIGHHLPAHDKAHKGSTTITARAAAGSGEPMDFWVPRSINRFHFTGGAKYLHGGAMPQEIVVPVIKVRLKRHSKAATAVRSVRVQVIGGNPKITTNRHRVQIIQTEAISERIKPLSVQLAIYDGDTPISSIETVTFDSASQNMEERMKSVGLSLKSGSYDKKKPYVLILRNAETEIEIQRLEATIDLAFSADF